ncbi:protein kinase [Chloroflexales bacterium ZM16-3]|nr:protein kinase [Chloroflexales bacterium ZM16-3]
MITCPSCGHNNPPGSRFCNACGARVAPADDLKNAVIAATPGAQAPAVGPTMPLPTSASDPEADLLQGALIGRGGRYVVERAIGRGGFGQAYLVRDQQLGRFCVAKRQMPNPAWSARIREQAYNNFRREAQLLSTLNTPGHPNIPEIFEYLPELHCLVMKYVEGRDLGWVLAGRGGKLPLDEGLAIIREVCSALAYMHSRSPEPVLHRDIKPSNILIDSEGRVWVIDFGLSKATPVQAIAVDTQHTQMAGTFGFTPPEQWRGEAVPQSDIYALCATLHMAITGYQPTMVRSDMEEFMAGRMLPFPPARSIEPGVPPLVEAIITKGMAFDPASRPTSAQLLAALDTILNPNARADLQAPDGATLADEAALAQWAEEHWNQAAPWLYNSLADQVTRLWGKNRLAGDIREIVTRNAADQHAGLDDLLALLDPEGYGAVGPRLTADRRLIDFGQLGPEDSREEILQLSNGGRRYVRVEIQVPRWVVPSALNASLPPGQSRRLRLSADMRRATESGRLRDVVLMRDRSGAGFRVELEAKLSRWGAVMQMIGGARRANWAAGDVRQQRQIGAHRGGVWALDVSPDGRQIASGGWDQRVRLWRTADGAAEGALDDHGGNVLSVAYSHDGRFLAAAGNAEQIKLWAVRARRMVQAISGHHSYLESVFFSSDGQLIISHSGDGRISLWRLRDGSLVQEIQPKVGGQTIAMHPDGRSVAIGCSDHAVRLWGIHENTVLGTLAGHSGGVNCVAYGRSGGLLASGDGTGVVRLWDLDTGTVRHELRGHLNAVRSVAIHPDGQTVASAGVDGSVRLWRVSDGASLQILAGHTGSVLRVTFSATGDLLVSGGSDGTIRLWQPG